MSSYTIILVKGSNYAQQAIRNLCGNRGNIEKKYCDVEEFKNLPRIIIREMVNTEVKYKRERCYQAWFVLKPGKPEKGMFTFLKHPCLQ